MFGLARQHKGGMLNGIKQEDVTLLLVQMVFLVGAGGGTSLIGKNLLQHVCLFY